MSENLIEVKKLVTQFSGKNGTVTAVDGVSFHVKRGETLGIVGESGCGKSVTSMSILRLIPKQTGKIASGEILFEGRDLAKLSEKEMRQIRGNEIAMIFQDSMTGLNPVMTIGKQLVETITAHSKMDKKEAWARAEEMLTKVGIPSPAQRLKEFPHQLSGGMSQRVMIAMALSNNPELLIADEPTTALDVTIQAQILDLLRNLKDKINSSIMLITHDLGVIAEMADYVVVMYAGRVVEKGTAQEIFANPAHPYTIGLMASKPMVGKKVDKLYSIPGKVPNPINMPNYCYFKDRCEMCVEGCQGEYPHMIQLSPTHMVSCYRYYGKEDAQNG